MYQSNTKLPNDHEIYKMAVIYNPNGYKLYQHFPFYAPPKFTQIGILGLKTITSGNPAEEDNKRPRSKGASEVDKDSLSQPGSKNRHL
jgi:hypothetical protein